MATEKQSRGAPKGNQNARKKSHRVYIGVMVTRETREKIEAAAKALSCSKGKAIDAIFEKTTL